MKKIKSDREICVAAFIYARSDSARLPGKVFLPLGNKSIIEIVVNRAKACLVEKVVLLTSDRVIDDGLEEIAVKMKCEVIRGNPLDLVTRTLDAIEAIKPKQFIRINADSPFFEPKLLNFILEKNFNYDVISNLIRRTFPYGVAVEIINANYYRLMAGTVRDDEKEHVTQHIYRTIMSANLLEIEQLKNHSHIRLTIDEKEDYNDIYNLWNEMEHDLSSYWEVLGLAEPN